MKTTIKKLLSAHERRKEHRRLDSMFLTDRPRRRVEVVVLICVAEGEWLGVEDLLQSCELYLDADFDVVLVDDYTQDGTYEKLQDTGHWVLRNPEKRGLEGLDWTFRRGLKQVLEMYDTPLVLKIDPDALILGRGLIHAIRSAIAERPRAGIGGTYKFDWNGERRDFEFWAQRMTRMRSRLEPALSLAEANGYELGSGVQGGAFFLTRNCLEKLDEMGLLSGFHPPYERRNRIAQDHLTTMLAYAAGFEAIDLGGPDQAFGLWDKGLPMPPEQLMAQGRLITHAMKYKDAESLAARSYFRALRERT